MHIRIILKVLEKYKYSVSLFCSRAPDMFLMSSHCMMILYFYLVCFTFSMSYSVLPFHFSLCSPISPSLLFFDVLSQAFIKCNRKAFVLLLFSCSVVSDCDPMDCRASGLPVLHCLPELAQTHVHWVSDAIQLSHPLLSLSPPAFNLSQHQGLFQWVGSSHQVANLGLTCLIFLQSKGLSRVFSNTTVQKHHFFSAQLSL